MHVRPFFSCLLTVFQAKCQQIEVDLLKSHVVYHRNMFSCFPFSKARLGSGRVVTVLVSDPDPKSHTPQIALLRWAFDWDGGDALGARRDNGLPQPGRHSKPRLYQTFPNLRPWDSCVSPAPTWPDQTHCWPTTGDTSSSSVLLRREKKLRYDGQCQRDWNQSRRSCRECFMLEFAGRNIPQILI